MCMYGINVYVNTYVQYRCIFIHTLLYYLLQYLYHKPSCEPIEIPVGFVSSTTSGSRGF